MENVDLSELSEKIYQKVLKEVVEASYNNRINEVLLKYGLQDEIEYSYYDINNYDVGSLGFIPSFYDGKISGFKEYNNNRLEVK